MQAARIVAPGELRIEETPLPEPGPRQVRFRVEGCGVSSASVAAWQGSRAYSYPLRPGEPGCEAWGVVDAIGKDVRELRVGERIATLSQGGFAEYDVADANATLRLPPQLPDLPFPGRSLGGALNVLQRSHVGVAQVVGVVGVGFLGALLVRLATLAGARVIALSRRPFSLALAREMGASATVELRDSAREVAEVAELTRGELCEVVIEATGQQAPLNVASQLVAVGGTLVIAGRHRDGTRELDLNLWSDRGIEVINAYESRVEARLASMRSALQAIDAKQLDPSNLYTHDYRLTQLEQALQTARSRPLGFIKALVRP